ncbi:MAG: hypothetical protein ACRCYR_09150 [Phycicoccus sp.]
MSPLDQLRRACGGVRAGVLSRVRRGSHTGEVAALVPGRASSDLVTACYAVLLTDTDPLATLTGLVAPGGSLLVVHHADVDADQARAHGFDPQELLSPADVAAGVGEGWQVSSTNAGRASSAVVPVRTTPTISSSG